jgi:predicted GH43/DUF377 family glycosyl hydrolase
MNNNIMGMNMKNIKNDKSFQYIVPVNNNSSSCIKLLENPLITPESIRLDGYKINRVYNPTVTEYNDKIYMIIRAEGDNTKTGILCLAETKDGKKFTFSKNNPIIKPDKNFDILGCEDPRLVKFDETYYLFYVGNNNLGPAHICLATSKDLVNWKKHGLIMTPKYEWEIGQIKAPAPIPVQINGKYYMYYLGQDKPWHTSIGLAVSTDLIHWTQVGNKPVLTPRKDHFDSYGVEPGVSVLIPQGILLIYNGWKEDGHINKTSWCLFDKNDPSKLLYRADAPIVAIKDQHVFTTGLYKINDQWILYWGAADTNIDGGILNLKKLLSR